MKRNETAGRTGPMEGLRGSWRSLTGKVVIATVVMGLLLTGVAGTAGAARSTNSTAPPTQKAANKAAHAVAVAEGHFSCANASQAVNAVQQLKNKFAVGLANLATDQAKAQSKAATLTNPRRKAYQNYLATFYGKRIAKRKKYEAHVLSPHFLARAAKIAKIAQTKCT